MRLVPIIFCFLYSPTKLLAQSNDTRQSIIDDFVSQRANNASLYQSPPINHIVPAFNTITYAGQFEELNLKLYDNPSEYGILDQNTAITVKGFKLEPHLALSLKNISLGFSVERSKLEEVYHYSSTGGSDIEQKQASSLETSGLGFNVAFVPFPKLHKQLKFAIIVGAQNLNVKHSISFVKTMNGPVSIEDSDLQKFQYTTNHYDAGMNLSWYAVKHFAIVPWLDYAMTDLSEAKRVVDADRFKLSGYKELMENDWKLFFLSHPKFRYGLDFAVQVMGLELRIGGLLGTLASLNKSVDYIEDKSVLLSASIEQKGN